MGGSDGSEPDSGSSGSGGSDGSEPGESEGIPAASLSDSGEQLEPGSGRCEIWYLNKHGRSVDTGAKMKVFNSSDSSFDVGDFVQVLFDLHGVPWATAQAQAGESRPPLVTIQAPPEGIPAAESGYIFGSAVCKVLISDPQEPGHWVDGGKTEEVFNPSINIELINDPTESENLGLGLGLAVWDGSHYVLASKLCNDDRLFFPPFEPLPPPESESGEGE